MLQFTSVTVSVIAPDKAILLALNHPMMRERSVKLVTETLTAERLQTEAAWTVYKNHALIGVTVFGENEQPRGIFVSATSECDPIAAYRVFKLVSALDRLDPKLFASAMVAGIGGRTEEGESTEFDREGDASDSISVIDAILGKDRVDAILAEYPPDIDPMVDRLREAGVEVNIRALRRHTDAGFQPSKHLKQLGVLSQTDLEQITERWMPQTEVLLPLMEAYFKQYRLTDEERATNIQSARFGAIRFLACGVECDPVLLAATGIVLGLPADPIRRMMVSLTGMGNRFHEDVCTFISRYGRLHLGDKREASTLLDEVTELMTNWKDMTWIID